MAAHNDGGSSTGRTNYYNISYGMLSTKLKEIPEGYSEVKESELKSKTEKVENIDLRNKFIEKTGDYPYACFYNSISGTVQSIEKDEYDKGISLKVTILDQDGDESILQSKFYGKTSADFLNRLANIKDFSNELSFNPYSIPAEAEIEGKKVQFYNQGVSIRENGAKTERSFNSESGLPGTEQIVNAEGKPVTSRVKQVNFLFDKVTAKFGKAESAPAQTAKAKQEPVTVEDDHDDLPF